jgi:hypothetical protein
MSFVVVFGTRLGSHEIGSLDAFCGGCVEVTRQSASLLEARHHVYFITYAADFAGYVMSCSVCNATVPLDTETGRRIEAGTYRRDVALTLRGLKDQEKRDRMVNAWGAVHCHELERARKSWWVGCCLAALTLVCLPLALLFGFELDGPVRLFALGTLVGLVVVAYQLCLRAIGDALLASRSDEVVPGRARGSPRAAGIRDARTTRRQSMVRPSRLRCLAEGALPLMRNPHGGHGDDARGARPPRPTRAVRTRRDESLTSSPAVEGSTRRRLSQPGA